MHTHFGGRQTFLIPLLPVEEAALSGRLVVRFELVEYMDCEEGRRKIVRLTDIYNTICVMKHVHMNINH